MLRPLEVWPDRPLSDEAFTNQHLDLDQLLLSSRPNEKGRQFVYAGVAERSQTLRKNASHKNQRHQRTHECSFYDLCATGDRSTTALQDDDSQALLVTTLRSALHNIVLSTRTTQRHTLAPWSLGDLEAQLSDLRRRIDELSSEVQQIRATTMERDRSHTPELEPSTLQIAERFAESVSRLPFVRHVALDAAPTSRIWTLIDAEPFEDWDERDAVYQAQLETIASLQGDVVTFRVVNLAEHPGCEPEHLVPDDAIVLWSYRSG